jgi:hypothetical protein
LSHEIQVTGEPSLFAQDKFVVSECEDIKQRINRLKSEISRLNIIPENLQLLNDKLDNLSEKVDKLSRFDWLSLFIGTIANVLVAIGANVELRNAL